MTKPRTEAECAIGPFWKVRVVVPDFCIHLASRARLETARRSSRSAS